MMRAAAVCAVAAVVGIAPTEPGAQASADGAADRHCVVEVISENDGVLETGPEHCYDTFAEAQDHASAASQTSQRDTEAEDTVGAASSSTIGVHFTGTSYTGSSITITGSVCSGGVWYPTGAWNNNIASSYHYCGNRATRFYDSSSCSGTSYAIYAAASNLGSMNDRASCVRYG